MKKFLSLIALAGVLVACEPEKIETAFSVAGAKVTVEVTVNDINTGDPVASGYTLSIAGWDAPTGNVFTYQAAEGKAIPETNVTLTVVYEEQTTEVPVHINKLAAGAEAKYTVTVAAGKIDIPAPPVVEPPIVTPDDVITYVADGEASVATVVKTYYAEYSHAQTHFHDGSNWAVNPTEFMLVPSFTYQSYASYTVATLVSAEEGYENLVAPFVNALTAGPIVSNEVYNPQISAYSIYRVFSEVYESTQNYNVIVKVGGSSENIKVIGDIDVKSYSVKADKDEQAIPDSYGHGHYSHYYHAGHGQADAHGYSANAGGGIVLAD